MRSKKKDTGNEQIKDVIFPCRNCGRQFLHRFNLEHHMKSLHPAVAHSKGGKCKKTKTLKNHPPKALPKKLKPCANDENCANTSFSTEEQCKSKNFTPPNSRRRNCGALHKKSRRIETLKTKSGDRLNWKDVLMKGSDALLHACVSTECYVALERLKVDAFRDVTNHNQDTAMEQIEDHVIPSDKCAKQIPQSFTLMSQMLSHPHATECTGDKENQEIVRRKSSRIELKADKPKMSKDIETDEPPEPWINVETDGDEPVIIIETDSETDDKPQISIEPHDEFLINVETDDELLVNIEDEDNKPLIDVETNDEPLADIEIESDNEPAIRDEADEELTINSQTDNIPVINIETCGEPSIDFETADGSPIITQSECEPTMSIHVKSGDESLNNVKRDNEPDDETVSIETDHESVIDIEKHVEPSIDVEIVDEFPINEDTPQIDVESDDKPQIDVESDDKPSNNVVTSEEHLINSETYMYVEPLTIIEKDNKTPMDVETGGEPLLNGETEENLPLSEMNHPTLKDLTPSDEAQNNQNDQKDIKLRSKIASSKKKKCTRSHRSCPYGTRKSQRMCRSVAHQLFIKLHSQDKLSRRRRGNMKQTLSTTRKKRMVMHYVHKGIKSHKCSICHRCFPQAQTLKKHLSIHDTRVKLHQCSVCRKSFKWAQVLKRHMRLHSEDKSYQCSTCRKCFSQVSNLKAHMLTHTGEKPFQCYTCGKCFGRRGNLQTHMKIHTGEKPYECPICQMQFIQAINLRTHIMVHKGEKPYQCPTCQRAFIKDQNLQRHMLTHTRQKPQ